MNPFLPTYYAMGMSPTHYVNLTIQCMGCSCSGCSGTCLASHRARFGCHNHHCPFHRACPLPPPLEEAPASSSGAPRTPTPGAANATDDTLQSAEEALAEARRALAAAHEQMAAAHQRAALQ